MSNWLATLLSVAPLILSAVPLILVIVAAIGRRAIIAFLEERVRQGIKHEFDKKLQETGALLSGAISAMVSRQAALSERRLKAAEQIWSCIIIYRAAKSIVSALSCGDAKHLDDEKSHNTNSEFSLKARLGQATRILKEGNERDESSKAEPFISPMVWALTQAYLSIVKTFLITANLYVEGRLPSKTVIQILNQGPLAKMAKETLPEHASMIDERGYRCYGDCLDIIEKKILIELHNMFEGKEDDEKTVQQAEHIVRYCSQIDSTPHH